MNTHLDYFKVVIISKVPVTSRATKRLNGVYVGREFMAVRDGYGYSILLPGGKYCKVKPGEFKRA